VLTEIQEELRRVVGAAGAEAALEADGPPLIRVETCEAVRRLPPEELRDVLRSLPDRAGPLALLEALDQWNASAAAPRERGATK
jgi:hypothetical protein